MHIVVRFLNKFRNQHFLHHVLHFKRNTRHRHQHLFVLFKPQDRCCSHFVLHHFATAWHIGLISGVFIEFEMTLFHHFEHIRQSGIIKNQFASEIVTKGGFCNIVFCGAKSTSSQHHIAFLKSYIYCLFNRIGIIGNHLHFLQFPTINRHFTGNPSRISVGNLPNQKFVTNGDN